MRSFWTFILAIVPGLTWSVQALPQTDPLASWYDKNGRPFLTKEPKLLLNDDNAGKPEGIHAAREYAYGPARGLPDTKIGTFTQALYDEATTHGWIVISMKNDWRRIFAFEP